MRDATESYDDLIGMCAAALQPDEFWCIESPHEGILYRTMSKRLDYPVLLFCGAMKCEWDDATEEGFRLTRARKPQSTEDAA